MYRAGERKPYTPHLVLMGNVTVSGAAAAADHLPGQGREAAGNVIYTYYYAITGAKRNGSKEADSQIVSFGIFTLHTQRKGIFTVYLVLRVRQGRLRG